MCRVLYTAPAPCASMYMAFSPGSRLPSPPEHKQQADDELDAYDDDADVHSDERMYRVTQVSRRGMEAYEQQCGAHHAHACTWATSWDMPNHCTCYRAYDMPSHTYTCTCLQADDQEYDTSSSPFIRQLRADHAARRVTRTTHPGTQSRIPITSSASAYHTHAQTLRKKRIQSSYLTPLSTTNTHTTHATHATHTTHAPIHHGATKKPSHRPYKGSPEPLLPAIGGERKEKIPYYVSD